MKAVVLVAPRELEIVENWPEPECGPHGVIVQIRGVGLCGTDLAVFDGKVAPPSLPWVMGHEGGGDIGGVGSKVTDRAVGQRVIVEPNAGCGHCATCVAGRTFVCQNRQSVGYTTTGLLAERVAIAAEYTWVVEPDFAEVALACFEPLAVAHNSVRRAGVQAGTECLVIGAGSVGQLVCQALLAVGARAYVMEPHHGRLELALQLGAMKADHHDGELYPFVFETSGVPEVWETAFNAVAKAGTLTVIGFTREPVTLTPVDLVRRQITIRGHLIYDHPQDFAATLAAVTSGALIGEKGVQARYPIEDAAVAFSSVREVPGKTWMDFTNWRQRILTGMQSIPLADDVKGLGVGLVGAGSSVTQSLERVHD